jgi:hypothetical protein
MSVRCHARSGARAVAVRSAAVLEHPRGFGHNPRDRGGIDPGPAADRREIMVSELEDGGALISAGLAAAEIDALQPGARSASAAHPHGDAHAPVSCANCGTTVAGAYCHACGQSAHVHRSLWHLVEEVLHGVLHFETKGWRTLPLLVARPGLLTRRYIDGQRTRYVSPLALFLFMVFLLFFVMSFSSVDHKPGAAADDRAGVMAELTQNVADSDEEVREAMQDLEKARKESSDVASAETALAAAQAAQKMAQKALSDFGAAARSGASKPASVEPGAGAAAGSAPAPAPDTDEPHDDWRAQLARQRIDTGHPKIDEIIRRQIRNPDLFLYKLKGTASKFSFLLIPISLPFLSLMFIFRRDVSVYDHAVFSLYSLAFMSLLFAVIGVLILTGTTAAVGLLMFVVPPVHMFMQLRGTYGLGVFGALWRTVALLGICGTAFAIFLALVVLAAAR